MLIHVFLAFPETAGRPLEEVDELFENHVPAWKTGNTFSRVARAERGDVEAIRSGSVASGGRPLRASDVAEKEHGRESFATDTSPAQKPVA